MNPRTDALLNRFLDGDLEAAESAALQRMMIEDPELRQAYYGLLAVDSLLAEQGESLSPPQEVIGLIAGGIDVGRVHAFPWVKSLAIAAIVLLTLFSTFLLFRKAPATVVAPLVERGPTITGSTDSRMTVAQRQNGSEWAADEVLRLERGSAVLKLNPTATANVGGPASIELVDLSGNVRLLEGMASFTIGEAGNHLDVHIPGGVLRNLDSRFTAEVFPDGMTNVRVESGMVEIRPRRGTAPIYLKANESVQLKPDGTSTRIRLPNQHFRSGLPKQVILFQDNFQTGEGRPLNKHRPRSGLSWKVLSEANPTLIRDQILDTSTGARRLLARLAPHESIGSQDVYIFTFHFVPPAMIDDKINRMEGVETISLVDSSGAAILSVLATATNSHRWQLRNDSSETVSPLTPVCSLWTHALTLCYGMDGRATLHDGSTAQAPIIAELHLAAPKPVKGILIANLHGGDMAFSAIEAAFLPGPPAAP